MWQRLTQAMGVPQLGRHPCYATAAQRNARRTEVNELVAAWACTLDMNDALAACEAAEAPCSPILGIAEIHADKHYRARAVFATVIDDRAGQLELPAPVPRLSATPAKLHSMGPALGNDNREIYEELLGMHPEQIAALRARHVI
jgi:crotonobetainyl-CoA:carnitine CoA-transferase CaiB-like acyl-CoA transferase